MESKHQINSFNPLNALSASSRVAYGSDGLKSSISKNRILVQEKMIKASPVKPPPKLEAVLLTDKVFETIVEEKSKLATPKKDR